MIGGASGARFCRPIYCPNSRAPKNQTNVATTIHKNADAKNTFGRGKNETNIGVFLGVLATQFYAGEIRRMIFVSFGQIATLVS